MSADPATFDLPHHHHLARILNDTVMAADDMLSDITRTLATMNGHLGYAGDDGGDADLYALHQLDSYDLHRALDVIASQLRLIGNITSKHVQQLSDHLVPSPEPTSQPRYWCPRCQSDVLETDLSRTSPPRHPRCGQPVRLIAATDPSAGPQPAEPAAFPAPGGQRPRLHAVPPPADG